MPSQADDPANAMSEAKYKEQLDDMAARAKGLDPYDNDSSKNGSVIGKVAETVSEYTSVVGKLASGNARDLDAADKGGGKVPGPPDRPHHDQQISEFLRDQHRSQHIGATKD